MILSLATLALLALPLKACPLDAAAANPALPASYRAALAHTACPDSDATLFIPPETPAELPAFIAPGRIPIPLNGTVSTLGGTARLWSSAETQHVAIAREWVVDSTAEGAGWIAYFLSPAGDEEIEPGRDATRDMPVKRAGGGAASGASSGGRSSSGSSGGRTPSGSNSGGRTGPPPGSRPAANRPNRPNGVNGANGVNGVNGPNRGGDDGDAGGGTDSGGGGGGGGGSASRGGSAPSAATSARAMTSGITTRRPTPYLGSGAGRRVSGVCGAAFVVNLLAGLL